MSKNRPQYRLIHQSLKTEILGGTYAPGDRLPFERELCRQFGVQRVTVRKALELLVQERLISKQPGRGSFVCEILPHNIAQRSSEKLHLRNSLLQNSPVWTKIETEQASQPVQRRSNMPENTMKPLACTDAQALEWMQQKSWGYTRLMAYYRCALMEIETKFNVLNEEFSLQHDRNPISSIKSRLKSMPSILDKLNRKELPATLDSIEENLNDVAGVRVICSFSEDVHTLADALLKQDDIQLIERKDYIANPKPNGYRSLHLIVSVPIFLENEKRIMKVEIQLRTIAMDCWASLEHQLRYKKDYTAIEAMATELSECARISADLDARMDRLRHMID